MFTTIDHQMMLQFPHDPRPFPMERKWNTSAHVELAPNCPRCASSNTKFCYYNNYSLSQPRYFCKGCRRYWTKGGSLRNVPVGGGCRKSRRAKSSSSSSSRGAASMNYGKNSNGSFSNSVIVQENGSNHNNSEIDLAVVFAKFLNQESTFQPEITGPELPDEPSDQELISLPNSLSPPESDHAAVECQNLTEDQIQESNYLLGGLLVAGNQNQLQEDQKRFQDMIMGGQDMNELGLQTWLGDELVQDALWSDAAAETSLSNVTWELPNDHQVQPQEFASLSVDDQLKISANDVSDINAWSSFDLSAGFEVFSRH